MAKRQTAIRISDDTKKLLESLATYWHISQSAIMEIAIREKAIRDGVVMPPYHPQNAPLTNPNQEINKAND